MVEYLVLYLRPKRYSTTSNTKGHDVEQRFLTAALVVSPEIDCLVKDPIIIVYHFAHIKW